MIEIKNAFCIKNNSYIFKNISLKTNAKTIGISGTNGVGKSTFLLQFMGINTNAKVFKVFGEDILKQGLRKDFAMVFQDAKSSINPLFDIGRLALFLAKDQKIANIKEKFLNLSEIFALRDIWHSYSHELSVGEAKKLNLIFALLKEPRLLILDELIAGLDESSVRLIITYLKSLNCNIILTSHDERNYDICDERYIFKKDGLECF